MPDQDNKADAPADNSAADDLDPVIEFYKKGLDRTLIRESLRMTVQERLDRHNAALRLVEELQRAGREWREKQRGGGNA